MVAGTVFVVAAAVASAALGRPWHAPLRLNAAVAVGPGALDPSSPVALGLGWGGGLHLRYTVAAGVLFARLRAATGAGRSVRATLGLALLYRLAQWLAGFYVVAGLAGWDWFPRQTDPLE